jgi:tetratricopeptide (TPR) repeat protein
MDIEQDNPVYELISRRFVGRVQALEEYILRSVYRHMKPGIYYWAINNEGGIGKTWLLHKIFDDYQYDPHIEVAKIIDFYDTRNHSKRGLQNSIRQALHHDDPFHTYDAALSHLQEEKDTPNASPGIISYLEGQADRIFLDCCKEAIVSRDLTLLFDTFEKGRIRESGRWLLRTFLLEIKNVVIVLAGRDAPDPAWLPFSKVLPFELAGLDVTETHLFAKKHHQSLNISEEEIQEISRITGGWPLIMDLILDLEPTRRQSFFDYLKRLLPPGKRVQDNSDLMDFLVEQFAQPSPRNKVIWAMAYLWRRFDLPILNKVVELTKWFKPEDYETIFKQLNQLTYVKVYPNQSHILHDEVQRIVRELVLGKVADQDGDLRKDLYQIIVHEHYNKVIKHAEALLSGKRDSTGPDDVPWQAESLAKQLRAEQLGYILDEDLSAGKALYDTYFEKVKQTHDYDFEELLWGEIREHLKSFADQGVQICLQRQTWLQDFNLYEKAEGHIKQMLDIFTDRQYDMRQSLGFAAMRQGKITEARQIFLESLAVLKPDEYKKIGEVHNNLAQTAIESGEWNQAIIHYAQCFGAAQMIEDKGLQAAALIGRSYIYANQGIYDQSRRQSQQAIDLLTTLPSDRNSLRRAMYAWMNYGTAQRHDGQYPEAIESYLRSLAIAEQANHQEGACHARQHLCISEHLFGRTFRRDCVNLEDAAQHQQRALTYGGEAIEMALKAHSMALLASGLHRLAKVFREIYRLETLPQEYHSRPFLEILEKLRNQGNEFYPPYEFEFHHEFLFSGDFTTLGYLAKAARMFELSALIATRAGEKHRALDAWMEASRTLLELRQYNLIESILRQIDNLKSGDYQEELFAILRDITQGDWHFEQNRYQEALEIYKHNYAELARRSGYAKYLLRDRLRNLEWRFSVLPQELVLTWCNELEREWLSRGVSSVYPEMLELLEQIRGKYLKHIRENTVV